ncbi:small-conductance mechanosensitive channel [Yoonia maritima]|uniref:Small-conductance mechanosensitive channel n=1 Tax=Yoonia maritima TaxID=1435347 RepID=A0A2T0W140_9RHOB|nr:DUF3772 domain-containing protein [Yoonia maritima]PRY78689.1 small-conductance mechanosensitive channel [Yoonia maritima]
MIRNFCLVFCLAVIWPLAGFTQDLPEEAAQTWEQVATRAESVALRDDVSQFAMKRLRAELVIWRDRFLERTTLNAGRVATVDAQIAALGPVPESGEEADSISDRRAALAAQRQTLVAPRLLAEEAYARANGLIGEFDAYVLQQQKDVLTERGDVPLNPIYLAPAITAVWTMLENLAVETRAGFSVQIEQDTLLPKLPRAGFFLLLAVALLGAGRRQVTAWRAALTEIDGRLMALWLFGLSLLQILVPVLGLEALTTALETLDVFGVTGRAIVARMPWAGSVVVFAWWLSRQIFPTGQRCGYLGYDADTRAAGRRYGLTIAWVVAVTSLFDAGINTIDVASGVVGAIELPAMIIVSLLLWRFGVAVKTKPVAIDGQTVSQGRVRGVVGKVCIVFAVVTPIMVAIGYGAGRNLIFSWLLTLGVIGVVHILQRLVHDLSAPKDASDEQGTGVLALMPVLINLGLYLASLPIIALVWGARVDDLVEIWARFREGFALGDSRISPMDFVTFALVFGLGYLLTRTIQGTLRKTVLPRTRLDLGGQNAVVAGFGYVGIILAAIVAITSAGIDLSNLAIVAGALSVGIGFGLQNIVSNFVSGIILLIERPVSEGDWIEVGGQMGYVRSISVRSTRIETFDRTDVIVPNADLVSGQVTNWTHGNLVGRAIVPVGVAYGTDVEKVTTILREIAEAHPLVIMTPPPNVLFIGFGADSLDFEIRAILRDVNFVLSTKSEINHAIAKRFAQEGIEIPFAQRDIWLRNPEALDGGKE